MKTKLIETNFKSAIRITGQLFLIQVARAFLRTRFFAIMRIATASMLISTAVISAAVIIAGGLGTEALVSVGSPPSLALQNLQIEPALAVDAAHPNILAAGAAPSLIFPLATPVTTRSVGTRQV
jgi:hypothetical protein